MSRSEVRVVVEMQQVEMQTGAIRDRTPTGALPMEARDTGFVVMVGDDVIAASHLGAAPSRESADGTFEGAPGRSATGIEAYVAWRRGGSRGRPPSGVRVYARTFSPASTDRVTRLELLEREGGPGWTSLAGEAATASRRRLCHDLNNPLASILGGAEVLQLMRIPDDARAVATRIVDHAGRMAEVVRAFGSMGDPPASS